MDNNTKDRILSVGQRVQLTARGVEFATSAGVAAWREKYGPDRPITGTIRFIDTYSVDKRYLVEMDGDLFACLVDMGYDKFAGISSGEGFNSFRGGHIVSTENDVRGDTLKVGQRVQLTARGIGVATPEGVAAWRGKYGPDKPIMGTITHVVGTSFVVHMDGEKFSCLSHGVGRNTFAKEHIESIE